MVSLRVGQSSARSAHHPPAFLIVFQQLLGETPTEVTERFRCTTPFAILPLKLVRLKIYCRTTPVSVRLIGRGHCGFGKYRTGGLSVRKRPERRIIGRIQTAASSPDLSLVDISGQGQVPCGYGVLCPCHRASLLETHRLLEATQLSPSMSVRLYVYKLTAGQIDRFCYSGISRDFRR